MERNERKNTVYAPGTKVTKASLRPGNEPKPFKSGLKVNTVKAVTTNPNTGCPAYVFEEDDSVVDCHICYEVPLNNPPPPTMEVPLEAFSVYRARKVFRLRRIGERK